MAHYEAYIARYGDRDFNEMPFNEVDGLIEKYMKGKVN